MPGEVRRISGSEVAAVCSMIVEGMTVTDRGVSSSGAVNLLDDGSAPRLASIFTDETSVLSGGAVAIGAASRSAALAAWVRLRPARPATAAAPRARRGRLAMPAKVGLRILILSPEGAHSPFLKLRGVISDLETQSQ